MITGFSVSAANREGVEGEPQATLGGPKVPPRMVATTWCRFCSTEMYEANGPRMFSSQFQVCSECQERETTVSFEFDPQLFIHAIKAGTLAMADFQVELSRVSEKIKALVPYSAADEDAPAKPQSPYPSTQQTRPSLHSAVHAIDVGSPSDRGLPKPRGNLRD